MNKDSEQIDFSNKVCAEIITPTKSEESYSESYEEFLIKLSSFYNWLCEARESKAKLIHLNILELIDLCVFTTFPSEEKLIANYAQLRQLQDDYAWAKNI